MIDVSDLMEDPDFASFYQVVRRKGEWIGGRFSLHDPEILNFYGPVQPANARELEQVPEGDRQKGIMKFLCKLPNRFCLADSTPGAAGVSDEIIWGGNRYKVLQVMPWDHFGWMRAFACLKGAQRSGDQPQ